MDSTCRFRDQTEPIPHHKLPSPFSITGGQDEERQNKEWYDGLTHVNKATLRRYEDQAYSIPSSSSAPPVPSPSSTGLYNFSGLRPPVCASPPPDYSLEGIQNGAYHSTYEAHYHQHGGTTVHHHYPPSPSHIPLSINPTHLYSRPPMVELAQREPVASGTLHPPMALLRPLTHALPKEYHNSTCPRYKTHADFPSQQQQQQQPSELPEAPTSDESTSDQANVHKTKTSYDAKTTHMLNTLFFETLGHGSKPSKRQRHRIQRRTGITSRHLTYWFSNHKRRSQKELKEYKRLLEEGKIHSYDSYIAYRNNSDVSELLEENV